MSLNDLTTAPIRDAVDFDNLPDQMGSYPPPPAPGPYRFKLPATLDGANFSKVQSQEFGDRVNVAFDEHAPLTIVQSTTGAENGQPFQVRISNVPRERGKKGSGTFASDFDYLLQALGEKARPNSNRGYADALLKHKGGAGQKDEFAADVEWSWGCNKDKAARWDDGQGGTTEVVGDDGQPRKGCGKKVYQNDPYIQSLKASNGNQYPLRIVCPGCSASVRAFGNLQRFRE